MSSTDPSAPLPGEDAGRRSPSSTVCAERPRDIREVVVHAPAGAIMIWAGREAPRGWLFANGAAVSRETYRFLFEVIGVDYGMGDGIRTFHLPDMRGRACFGCFGADTGDLVTGATAARLARGGTGGEEQVTLDSSQIPPHTHNVRVTYGSGDSNSTQCMWHGGCNGQNHYMSDANVGGGHPHSNMPPFILMPYIISTGLIG
jgi:microcystin-dependent protein